MSKEADFSVAEAVERTNFFQDSLPEWSFGVLGFLHEAHGHARKLWSPEARQNITSSHKNWDNTNYCRRFSQEASYQYSLPEFLNALQPNFETFTDEYSLGTPIKTYKYDLREDTNGNVIGTSGVDNSYKEDSAVQAKRFQDEKLAKVGKRQQRAAIETFNCDRLDTWIARIFNAEDVAVGTKLMWFSPPGHLIEGYQSVSSKNHSFIWVYEKKSDGEKNYVEMTQVRCWPNLQGIQEIQKELRALSISTGNLIPFPDSPGLTKRNQVIAQMIELPENVSLERIQQIIFANEKRWAVKRSQMPDTQLSELAKAAFLNERQRVLDEFLRPIYKSVLGRPDIAKKLTTPFNDPFWKSGQYREAITQLDTLFAIAKQSLDKWLEIAIEEKGSKTFSPIPIGDLNQLYTLRLKHISEGLSIEEHQMFNTLAPSLLSVGNRLLSVGMCGVGTIIPVNLITRINVNALGSSVTHVGQISSVELNHLSGTEKKQFRNEVLANYAPLEVIGRNGQKHLFWVLKEYYDDYAGQCYEDENGVLKGPCDIPLTMEDDEFILTDEKYQELLAASEKETEDDELKKLETEEALRLANAKSEQERDAIRSHYGKLKERFKHRVSITEWLNDDITYTPMLRAA